MTNFGRHKWITSSGFNMKRAVIGTQFDLIEFPPTVGSILEIPFFDEVALFIGFFNKIKCKSG